jgi:hypothetical protein
LFSCHENRDSQINEFSRSYAFIKHVNQEELERSLYSIKKCGDRYAAILELKARLLSLNKIHSVYITKANSLKSKAELEAFRKELFQTVNASTLTHKLAAKHIVSSVEINLSSLSEEEARIVLKINIVLLEKAVRDNILSQYAIDCP